MRVNRIELRANRTERGEADAESNGTHSMCVDGDNDAELWKSQPDIDRVYILSCKRCDDFVHACHLMTVDDVSFLFRIHMTFFIVIS